MSLNRWLFVTLFLFFQHAVFAQVNFTEQIVHSNTRGAAGLYACDLDADGDPDILAAIIEDRDIAWFRNDGGDPIVWTKLIIDGAMISAHSVHANDVDGDGDLDVLGTSYGSAIKWYENNGQDSISWTAHTVTSTFSQAHEVYSADIDGDSDIDVLGAASELNRISLWINEGGVPVTWTEQIIDPNAGMAKSVRTADIDGDGLMDILSAALLDNDVKWYRNGGGNPIAWTTYTIDGSFSGAHRVQGADMDGDGDTDVIGAGYLNHQIAWWRNDGGTPIHWTKQIIGRNVINACIAEAADIDLDGRLDVVGTGQGINSVIWWRNGGEDSVVWTEHVVTSDFLRAWPLYAFDADADGDSDLVSGSSFEGNNQVRFWRNDLHTAAGEHREYVAGDYRVALYPNPFNGSTIIRFAIPRAGSIRITVYDLLGREVSVLYDATVNAGDNQVVWSSGSLPSGIYWLAIMQESRAVAIAKAVILR